jgi:hypothetical protein
MHNDLTPAEMEKIALKHVSALMEHFEAVQILASVQTQRGTEFVNLGAGNWFSRQGMAQDFIGRDRAQTSAHEIAKAIPNQPPDEGEDWKKA